MKELIFPGKDFNKDFLKVNLYKYLKSKKSMFIFEMSYLLYIIK